MKQNTTKSPEEKCVEFQEQLKDFSLLLEEILTFNSTLNVESLLHKIMESATRLMKAEASSLMLLDEETEELVFTVALGEQKSILSKARIKSGEGVAGFVLKEGKPLIVNNTGEDEHFSNRLDAITGFKTKSILCVPLKVNNKVIGVLEVFNSLKGGFVDEDIRLFTTFANLASVSIQNSRHYSDLQNLFLKETQNQFNRLEVMSQVSGVTLSSMDFSNLFKTTMEVLLQSLDSETGGIFLSDGQDNNMFPVVLRGFYDGPSPDRQKFNICENVAREVLQTKKPFQIKGFTENSILSGEIVLPEEKQSVIGIPIKHNGSLKGVIVVFSRKGKDLSSEDIDLLKGFSGQVASTLEKIDITHLSGKQKAKLSTVKFSITREEEYKLYLSNIINHFKKGLIITDIDFNIQMINKKCESILGIPRDTLEGQSCLDCHSHSLHEAVKDVKNKFLENKKLNKLTFVKKLRSENKVVKAEIFPQRDAFSNLIGFFMFVKEI